MRIVVVGSGLIGLTTAFVLHRRGHEVTVVDRQAGPGLETSFANGALLTPSMSEPWNAPGSWRVMLASLLHSDAPLQLRVRTLPSLAGWGIQFLRNSKPTAFERNTLSNLRLGLYSLRAAEWLRQEAGIEYGRSTRGALKLFRDGAALDRAEIAAHRLMSEGLEFQRLSAHETIELEPALAPIADQLSGALHYPADETGDAYQFCVALAEQARRRGVEFCFDSRITGLETREGRVTAMVSERRRFVADRYIVAAGSFSSLLLRPLGIRLPIQPAKGYSVTVDRPPGATALQIPLIDEQLHAGIVPIGNAIRVAGTAEFAGYDGTMNPDRARNLIALLRRVLPDMPFEEANARPWCGLRPMTADGVPIIGATPVSNLLINSGHGHLGWTLAAGSAYLLADIVDGVAPAVDPTAYALKRFSA